MKSNLIIKKLFVYSEKNKKFFYTEFSDGVNIIYGKNTAGKSITEMNLMGVSRSLADEA